MKVKVEYSKGGRRIMEAFEEALDAFMKRQGFHRWASGFNMETEVRDIAYKLAQGEEVE